MPNIRASLAALVLCGFVAASQATPLDEGVRLMANGNYPEAIRLLERESRANPGSPDILLNLGWAYWHAKKLDEAHRVGVTLVKLDAQNPTFLVFLANTDIQRKDYGEALVMIDKALAIAPDDRDASMVQARVLFFLKREKEAMAVLDRIIKNNPDYTNVLYRKAVFLEEMGRKDEALVYLQKLTQSEPRNLAFRRSRAKTLYDLGYFQEAKAEWKEIVRVEPDEQSLLNLGWAYWHDREIDDAWKIGATLLKLDDNNPVFLRFMANMEIEKMNYPEALRLSQKGLKLAPGDRDASLMLAKSLFRLQREKEAMAILRSLMKEFPDQLSVQYHWADYLARTGQSEEALAGFDRLIKGDPANPAFQLGRAQVLYELSRFDEAVAQWKKLAASKEPPLAALRRLRDDAFDRRDWPEAVQWQKRLIAAQPADVPAREKLAKIFGVAKDFRRALKAAESAAQADPLSIGAQYLKAESLAQEGYYTDARKAYEGLLVRNPNSDRALDGLWHSLQAMGDYEGALRIIHRAQQKEQPYASPYLIFDEMSLLANMGQFESARRLVAKISEHRIPVIPILLYHGISKLERTDSIPQRKLREQFMLLKAEGYESITVGELDLAFQGRFFLPKKPIVLTFDDGRSDTFENADPVLKEAGFRGTMFVHVSKLRKPHFHASPEDIRKWRDTGRWEMQAHGSQAHDPMKLDAAGRLGHFLANRMWLPVEQRLETMEEFRARVDNDYKQAREGVEQIAPGKTVVGFAYPFGDYGQSDYTNTPESAAINQELVRKHFHLAFIQEQYGFNSLLSNPTQLKRFEVPRHMTAAQLVAHLALLDPWARAKVLEAELWIRSNQVGRAGAALQSLQDQGIAGPPIIADQGIAYAKDGDAYDARKLFARADADRTGFDELGNNHYDELNEQSKNSNGPEVGSEAQSFSDNYAANMSKLLAHAGASVKAARLQAFGGISRYADHPSSGADQQRVTGREAGLNLRWFLNPRVALESSAGRRYYSGAGDRRFGDNASGALTAQVLAPLKLGVRGGMSDVETASAIQAGITYRTYGGTAAWDPAMNWKVSGSYDVLRFNDANQEHDLRLGLMRQVTEGLTLGPSFLRSDSGRASPEYYTPVSLTQYTGIVALTQRFGGRSQRTGFQPAEAALQYEGGYGTQAGVSRIVNSVKGSLGLRFFDSLLLSLHGQYSKSTSYESRRFDAGLSMGF